MKNLETERLEKQLLDLDELLPHQAIKSLVVDPNREHAGEATTAIRRYFQLICVADREGKTSEELQKMNLSPLS